MLHGNLGLDSRLTSFWGLHHVKRRHKILKGLSEKLKCPEFRQLYNYSGQPIDMVELTLASYPSRPRLKQQQYGKCDFSLDVILYEGFRYGDSVSDYFAISFRTEVI